MSISEEQGVDILERVFTGRGYRIVRGFPFHEAGVTFEADGWDPEARVGFEFLTSEARDHEDMRREEYEELSARILRGDLELFVVDEVEVETEEDLVRAAEEFLDELEARREARGATDSPQPPTTPASTGNAKTATAKKAHR